MLAGVPRARGGAPAQSHPGGRGTRHAGCAQRRAPHRALQPRLIPPPEPSPNTGGGSSEAGDDAMKLVTFAVSTPIGRAVRLGALLDGHQDGRIVDLTSAYAAYLAAETDEPTPRELAALRTPPDLIGWLRGAHKARAAAEAAIAHAARRLREE